MRERLQEAQVARDEAQKRDQNRVKQLETALSQVKAQAQEQSTERQELQQKLREAERKAASAEQQLNEAEEAHQGQLEQISESKRQVQSHLDKLMESVQECKDVADRKTREARAAQQSEREALDRVADLEAQLARKEQAPLLKVSHTNTNTNPFPVVNPSPPCRTPTASKPYTPYLVQEVSMCVVLWVR